MAGAAALFRVLFLPPSFPLLSPSVTQLLMHAYCVSLRIGAALGQGGAVTALVTWAGRKLARRAEEGEQSGLPEGDMLRGES